MQPPGAVGEIFVGGRGVADGYVGLPELTAKVQIRGYRVELGEVRSALFAVGGLEQVVVAVREGMSDALVAFVVVSSAESRLTERLRVGLTAALPGYMVSSDIVVVDHIPLTVNGKTDTKAPFAMGEETRAVGMDGDDAPVGYESVSLTDLLRCPTPRELADHLERRPTKEGM